MGGVFPLPRFPFGLAFVLACASVLRAEPSLDQVRTAQALLGPEIWSRVIRVENRTRAGRYPRTLHALVFELANVLWFYTPADGTQSLSLHVGRLEEEKADLGPLLRDIEPGFTRWSVVPPERLPPPVPGLALGNACFIESIAGLRERLARGERLERPRLLSFYEQTALGMHGHTVLAFGTDEGIEIFDPARPAVRRTFAPALGPDALALARAFEGPGVVKARFVTIELAAPLSSWLVSRSGAPAGDAHPLPDRS